ncbi:hypothetical protein CJP74_01725 [Psittacicella melopsittaci]|uniref:Uncharacterized protein n=1 Tax=Psittacicella melopsittaci TaxID=2028576 RepID=A0A3A1Y7I0_9GAMM|nr:hypothetical protein CJP74_01725 [Psittacicella melopsittaci]
MINNNCYYLEKKEEKPTLWRISKRKSKSNYFIANLLIYSAPWSKKAQNYFVTSSKISRL